MEAITSDSSTALTPNRQKLPKETGMSLGLAAGLTEEGLKLYMLNQDVSEDSPVLYK